MAKVARRKRGRPPGEPTQNQSIRMPMRLREQLWKEAEGRRISPTRVVIEALEDHFGAVPGYEQHAADLQAILDAVINTYWPMFDKHGNPVVEWWSSPFAVRAILLAFAEVVSAIAPKGDPVAPEIPDWAPIEAETFKSPETRAKVMAQLVLHRYRLAKIADGGLVERAELHGRHAYGRVAVDSRLANMRRRWSKAAK